MKPLKRDPLPQRGQRPARPAAMGETEIRSASPSFIGLPARPGSARSGGENSAPASRPFNRGAPRTPDIDAGEKEQPYDVDEVPIPGRELEAEMLFRRELAGIGADQADNEE